MGSKVKKMIRLLLSISVVFLSSIHLNGCIAPDAMQATPMPETVFGSGDFVLSATPQGTVADIQQFYAVVVIFAKPMVALSALPEGDGDGPLEISPSVNGKFRWMGTNTLSFIPSEKLPLNTRFTVTIPAGTRALDGSAMSSPYVFSFETMRPKLISHNISEMNGTTLNPKIMLTFNQPIDIHSAKEKIRLIRIQDGANIPVSIEPADSADLLTYYNYGYDQVAGSPVERIVRVKPITSLRMQTSYQLQIASGLKGREGVLGSSERVTHDISTYGPLEFLELIPPEYPNSPFQLKFTNRIDADELKSHLTITPHTEINEIYPSWSSEYPASIYAQLQPQTDYTITIDPEIKDAFDNALGVTVRQNFRTGDYASSVYFETGEHVLESYLRHDLNVAMINPGNIDIQMAAITQEEVIGLAKEGLYRDNGFNRWAHTISERPDLPRNATQYYPLALDPALASQPSGFVFVQMKHDTWNDYQRALIQVTDIGITAKFARDKSVIAVSQLKDGRAARAFVQIRDDMGNLLWSGYTNSDGVAETQGWSGFGLQPIDTYNEPRLWVFATRGDQTAYARSDNKIDLWRFNIPYAWYVQSAEDEISSKLFTNQGIYRPGDKVQFKAMLRRLQKGAWSVPTGLNLKARIFNPSNDEVYAQDIVVNPFGGTDFEFTVPENAPLGYYYARLYTSEKNKELSGESFQVQEFRPVESAVTINSVKSEYVWSETLKLNFDAHYLFGAPMANASMNWSITRNASSFQPEGYDGYFFGKMYDYDGYYGRGAYQTVLASSSGTLDQHGLMDADVVLNAGGVSETSELVIEGTVEDKNRQYVSGRTTVRVHQGAFYIGLKPSTTFMTWGEPLSVDVVAVTPDGKKTADKKIELELIRREWHSVREKSYDGSYRWTSSQRDTTEEVFTVRSRGEIVTQKLNPASTGYYILRATSSDPYDNTIISESYVYVTGESYAGWKLNDGDRIDLVANKSQYKVGEKAKILVKSPYERARALVSVEREGIIRHFMTELKGNAASVEIPITAEMAPNAFVSVTLLQGRTAEPVPDQNEDIGKPSFKIGYINLSVDPSANKLAVKIQTPKNKFQPGEWMDVDVEVADKSGHGQIAEVTLYVEDVGVLNLVGYQTPDVFSHFYKQRELQVATTESRRFILDQLVKRDLKEKGGVGGGGGEERSMPGIAMRKDFKSCVYWNPSVITDARGKARVRVQLPDNLTMFRIFAVAHTRDSRFGSDDHSITVSKDLMLRPALPRFARIDDAVEAGAVLHNNTTQAGTATIRAQAEGVEIIGAIEKTVELQPGASQEVRFQYRALKTGPAKFSFTAQMRQFSDGVEITIPVRMPVPTETVALAGSTTDKTQEQVIIPGSIFENTGSFEIKTSSTALVDLDGSVKYLFEYPYGCLEQRTSRVLPVILFGDVVTAFGLTPFEDKTKSVEAAVKEYLNEIPKFQQYGGGFSYWTGDHIVSPYVSVYAMFALTKAKAIGYDVPKEIMDNGVEYLKKLVRNNPVDRYGVFYWHNTNAFALAVLADHDVYDAASAELLFQRRSELPLFARAMLLQAIVKGGGHKAMTETLRRDLMNAIKMNPTTAHFEEPNLPGSEWSFHSPMRTTAAILQTFIELDGTNVPWAEKVVKYMLEERKQGRWRTTQENLYVFYALGTYFRNFEDVDPDFKATVRLAGRQLLSQMYQGRTTQSHTSFTALAEFPSGKALLLDITKTGAGRLYYNARMTYAPRSGGNAPARDEGLRVSKEIQDASGHVVTDGRYKAGKIYKITLTVSTAQARQYVVLDDPLPAGFEAINTDLATSASSYGSGTENRWWEYGGFTRSEMRDDRVVAFADYFENGTQKFVYYVRATTYGTFALPATKAEAMYHPEIFGTTAATQISVE
ncbi:MAG TPA: alpha-2-macroglobulin family protein [bacterium]|nr:alpha-2-macroglobulin family protein [bacterium]